MRNKNTAATLIHIGKSFIIISFLIPFLSLTLRIWNYDILIKFSFDQDVTNPASAICFILLSLAVWIVRDEDISRRTNFIFNAICIFVIAIGVTRIITQVIDQRFYLDEILFREQIHKEENFKGGVQINLMSATTGIILALLGISILLANYKNPKIFKIAQFISYLIILGTLLNIYGYIYQIGYLKAYREFDPIPMYNTFTIFFIASGILLLRPYKGSMATLVSENPTEIILLRLLALFIPLFLGLFIEKGKDYYWFGKEFGTALYASTTFAISMILLGWKSSIQFKVKKRKIKNKEKIEKDKKLLKRILDMSPSAVNIVDLESEKFLYTNKTSEEKFRINNKPLQKLKYTDVMKRIAYEKDKKTSLNRLVKLKKLKKDQHDILTYRIYDKDKKIRWVHSKATGYTYKGDKAREIIANSIDFTAQKKLQAELVIKAKEIEEHNKKLRKINMELEGFKKHLSQKVEERIEELKLSEQTCKDFFENSFEGIIRYELKGIDGIDINLKTEEQVRLLQKHTLMVEANNEFARIHGYNSPKEINNIPMSDFLGLSFEDEKKILTKYVESGYRLKNTPISQLNKNGDKVHLLTNVIGTVRDNKLVAAWGTQKLLED